MSLPPNRRAFLAATATGTVTAAVTGERKAAAQPPPPGVLKVRLSAYDPRARRHLESYARGVAEMKRRSERNPSDPIGWTVQAAIHGGQVPNRPDIECQHAIWWFLPWHRAYLYYFERIVRKLSSDDGFTLPYWDWNKPGRKAIPPAFRDTASSLYDRTRVRTVNRGFPLSGPELDVTHALADADFISAQRRQGFGGPPEGSNFKGVLENPPHDAVHVRISGNMGDPVTAARDPIFWLHHCNIDRLWEAWQARGRDNPPDPAWAGKTFPFFDENGTAVTARAGDFGGTATVPGGYVYDDVEGPSPFFLQSPELRAQVVKEGKRVVAMAAPNDPKKAKAEEEKKQLFGDQPRVVLAGPGDTATVLGAAPVTVEARLTGDKPKVVAQALKVGAESPDAPPQIVLNIEGVTFDGPPGVVYRVFVNRPDATAATDAEDAHYVGSIALFGRHKGAAHGAGHAAEETFSFNITESVRQLQQREQWDEKNVKVTFAPVGVGDENAPKSKVSFKGISLAVEK